ncbi:MAG TPA: hypothetical protein VF192_01450 [Longimicrobiales bacterium]
MAREVEVTARRESSTALEVPDGPEGDELIRRMEDGDLDAIVEAGDVTSAGASLVDWTAKEVG